VLRREERRRDLRVVADDHRHGHGLPEGPAEAEKDRAHDSRASVEESRADRFEPRRAQGVCGFSLSRGNGPEDLARHRRRERDHHDGEDEHRRQHSHSDRRPGEERELSQLLREPDLEFPHERDEHEDPPQAVHDRRDRGEQLRQKDERPAQAPRRELVQIHGDTDRDRSGDQEGENRRIERAPQEGEGAELARHRVPDPARPEAEAELPDR
jgi:hypothetical protein